MMSDFDNAPVRKVRLVLIRQLHGSEPQVSAVFDPSDDPEVEDQEHYMKACADDHIKDFIRQFPEFLHAKFYKRFVEI